MIGIVLQGDKQLAKTLKALPDRIFRKVVTRANRLAMSPVLKDARARVPIRYGVLKRSLGAKTKAYPKKGIVFTAVGARVGFAVSVGSEVKMKAGRGDDGKFTSRGTKKTSTVIAPTKYAHLVELGHGGPHPAQAHPFLRPAFEASKAVMLDRYKQLLQDGIEREAEKASHG